MGKNLALRTGPDGRAVVGSISPVALDRLVENMSPIKELVKAPGDEAPFHNPTAVTVIEIVSGSHTICISTDDGGRREFELVKGDRFLFHDFKPKTEPQIGSSGHASKAGPSGATLRRWEDQLSSLDFEAV